MGLTTKEWESVTLITYDGKIRRFTTSIPRDMRYMKRKGLEPTNIHKLPDGEEIVWEFELPEGWKYLPRPTYTRKRKADGATEETDEEDDTSEEE
jgi:hypothetical protein